VTLLRDIVEASPLPESRRTAMALWPASESPYDFNPNYEADPFIVREWLLQVARSAPNDALGRKLRAWHRTHQKLRRGEVLDRCFAAAVARHSTGFLLASLENPPDPSVLKERIYPAAIRSFAEGRSPQVIARLENDDSPLANALKEALGAKAVTKKHTPAAGQLTRGEAIYARTCAACHQSNGTGVDTAFPPLDRSKIATGDPAVAIRIILHGLTGPVEVPGKPAVNSLMPPVASLNDADIADVLSYVRHAWSNDAAPVSTGDVTKVRTATKDRQAPWTMKELR
jgi:mono/diheme cytochrome c family protein